MTPPPNICLRNANDGSGMNCLRPLPCPVHGGVGDVAVGGHQPQSNDAGAPPGPGVKHDDGKTRYYLLPWRQLRHVADVLTFGAKKYGVNNWQNVDNRNERYFSATIRHLEAWREGEHLDPESKIPHLAHAVTSLLFMLWCADDDASKKDE